MNKRYAETHYFGSNDELDTFLKGIYNEYNVLHLTVTHKDYNRSYVTIVYERKTDNG